MAIGTIPFALVGAHTSYVLLAFVLVVRGAGLGATMMPAMAAAFAVLTHAEVPRATSALNAIQRIGGSLGTALLAVVLQHEFSAALPGSGGGGFGQVTHAAAPGAASRLAEAFAHTFWWALGLSILAAGGALALALIQRAERQRGDAPAVGPAASV